MTGRVIRRDNYTSGVDVPGELRARHQRFWGADAPPWLNVAPALADSLLVLWSLTPDGPATHGAVAWIIPVRRADGTAAVLKLQPVDDETAGEPLALRAWASDGAVRLLEHDVESSSMLLERLCARCFPSPATVCCTGTCTTTTRLPRCPMSRTAARGLPSTPSRSQATRVSSYCPRSTTAGTTWSPPATSPVRYVGVTLPRRPARPGSQQQPLHCATRAPR